MSFALLFSSWNPHYPKEISRSSITSLKLLLMNLSRSSRLNLFSFPIFTTLTRPLKHREYNVEIFIFKYSEACRISKRLSLAFTNFKFSVIFHNLLNSAEVRYTDCISNTASPTTTYHLKMQGNTFHR